MFKLCKWMLLTSDLMSDFCFAFLNCFMFTNYLDSSSFANCNLLVFVIMQLSSNGLGFMVLICCWSLVLSLILMNYVWMKAHQTTIYRCVHFLQIKIFLNAYVFLGKSLHQNHFMFESFFKNLFYIMWIVRFFINATIVC
jgi:hypothetical protein